MAEKNTKQKIRDEQIYQLTTLVAGRFSLQEVLDKLAETAVKVTRVKACSIRLLDEDAGDLKMRSTFGLSEEYRNKGVVSKEDTVVKAAFAGEAVVLDDVRVDDRVKYKEAAIKEGLVSQLTVAMKFRDVGIGVLRLYSPKPKRFAEDDISLARLVASQCAVAITNARLYSEALDGARIAEQMRLAGVIQRRMIPECAPEIHGLDISARYIPCFDVGGDFYEFYPVTENRLVTLMADVVGKGMPAAIMMSWFKGAITAHVDTVRSFRGDAQAYWGTQDRKTIVGKIIGKLNEMACNECRDGEFITLFYCSIDTDENTITYCNCGHEPTVLIRDGRAEDLDKGGLVLGVTKEAEYEIETIELKDDDCLLFYTDGLIDAVNFEGQMWGREQMLETAVNHSDGKAEQMLKNILRYRRRFVGLARQTDDTSVVVIKAGKGASVK
jgi:serine phosphatase RsbU (regulator of sigma subunit)